MSDKPSIQELFDSDPLKLTNENIDDIISEFQKKRQQYLLGNQKSGIKAVALPTGANKAAADEILKSLGLLL